MSEPIEPLVCERCEGPLNTELPLYSETAGPLCELCALREENTKFVRDLKWARESKDRLQQQLDSKTKELETEREGLVSWLRSRTAQQGQALSMRHISKDSKLLIEVEVGLVERYLANILEGKHRNNNPAVSTLESTRFKPLREMELDAVKELIEKTLVGLRKELVAAKPGESDFLSFKGSEEALVTLLSQLHAGEHQ